MPLRTRHHLYRQGVTLTSPEENCTGRNKPQGREGGAADGTRERRVGGTEPAIDRFQIVHSRESGTATGDQHSQLRFLTPALSRYNCKGVKTLGLERRGNGEGRGSKVMRENRPRSNKEEKEGGGESEIARLCAI